MAQAPSGFTFVERKRPIRALAFHLLDDREEVVRHRHHLCRLRVRVRAVNRVDVLRGQAEQRRTQPQDAVAEGGDAVALPHAIGGHRDVVAAARRVQAPGHLLAGGFGDEVLEVEEQVLVGAIEGHLHDRGGGDAVERRAQHAGVALRHDVALGEHHQVRVVDVHERRQQVGLGVLEVVGEYVGDVLGGKAHFEQYTAPGRRSLTTARRLEDVMRKTGLAALLVVAALVIAPHAAHAQTPPQGARAALAVPGLRQPVEVIRDRWGINHIYAQNEDDLFMAQGYLAAKDRLFQFEMWRRQATAQWPRSARASSRATSARACTSSAATSTPSSTITIRAANRSSRRTCAA
jgi:hypothetical protein